MVSIYINYLISEDTLKKCATRGDIECNASGNKSKSTQGNAHLTHTKSRTVHKKTKTADSKGAVISSVTCRDASTNDLKSKDETKARKKTMPHDKIKKVMSDGISRSKEAGGIGDSKRRNKMTKKLSKQQLMQDRQLEEKGQSSQMLSLSHSVSFCSHLPYYACFH